MKNSFSLVGDNCYFILQETASCNDKGDAALTRDASRMWNLIVVVLGEALPNNRNL